MKFTLLLPLLLAVAPLYANESDPVKARYEQLLERTPEPGPAFDKLYDTYARGEGLEALEKRWQAAAEKGGAPYWLLLGYLAERRGEAAAARTAFRKAAELAVADYRAWAALGKLEAGQGRQAEAIGAYEQALGKELPEERRIEIYRALALSQQRRLDPEAALKTYERALKEYPNDPYLLDEIAEAQTEAGKFDNARASYETLRTMAGGDPFRKVSATVKLAQLEERQGKMTEALKIYENALAMTTESSWMHREVRNRIEMVYRRQDDLPGLISYYTAWLERNPKDVEVALRLSKAAGELNQKAEAVRWLSLAAEWAPDRRDLQMELARALRANAQTDDALKLAVRLTERFPDELSYHELRGEVEWDRFQASKDPQHRAEALASWGRLAPEGTKDAARIASLADLLRRYECTDEALASYQRALEVSPESMDLRERKAAYLFELKREEEGWKLLQTLVEGERATAENYRRLALLQARYDKPEAALEAIEAGLKLAPEDFALLSLKWRLLVEGKREAEALVLYEPLLKAGPAMADQIDAQQVRLLTRMEPKALAAEIGKLKAAAADAPEHQLRLLTRLLLQQRDLEGARKVLAGARERFPASGALVRAEVELCRAENRTDDMVAALRRLIELEPKQTGAYLQEIARIYLQANQSAKAIEAAQAAVQFSPAHGPTHQFLATTYQSLGEMEKARAAFRDAIRLSEQPNPVRSLLASLEMAQGKMDAAQALYEEVFEAETTPDGKRRALQMVAMAYIQSGQVDRLIARFRERQKAEEGGWRYAAYLAAIYLQLGDAAQARQELNKVLASRPNDTALLRQLIELADREGSREEAVRFATQLLAAEPSAQNASDLALRLAQDNIDSAMELLLTQSASIEADPQPWMPVFAALSGHARFEEAFAIMQRALLSKQDDAAAQFRLAEFYLVTRQDAKAAEMLWRIYDVESVASDSAGKGAIVSSAWPAGIAAYYTPILVRIQTASGTLQEYQRLRARSASGAHSFRMQSRYYGYGMSGQSANTARANADRALVYLAALAVDQQQEDAFKATLNQRGAALPTMERIGMYQLAGAEDIVQSEIAAALREGNMRREDQLALLSFFTFQNIGKPELKQQLVDAIFSSAEPLNGRMLMMLKQVSPSEKVDAALKEWLQTSEAAEKGFLPFAIQTAAAFGDVDLTERLMTSLERLGVGQQHLYYDMLLINCYIKAGQREKLHKFVIQSYEKTILSGGTPGSAAFGFPGMGWYGGFSGGSAQLAFGMPTRHLNQAQAQYLSMLMGTLKQGSPELPKEFLGLIAKLKPEGEDALLRHELAQAILLVQNDDRDTARAHMSKAFEMRPDTELAIQSALLEQDSGNTKAALALLERTVLPASTPDKGALMRLLQLAKSEQSEEVVRKTLSRLIGLTLQRHEEQALIADLKQYGLGEKAEELQQRVATSGGSRHNPHQISERLRQLRNESKKEEAIALAHTILVKTPSLQPGNNDQYNRSTALDTLRHFKVLDIHIADLEKEREEGKALTTGLGLKLIEAYQDHSQEKALSIVRELVKLSPDNQQLIFFLANFLQNHNQIEEALPLQIAVLQKSPDLWIENPYPLFHNIGNALSERERKGEDASVLRKQFDELLNLALGLKSSHFGANQNGLWFYQNLGESVKRFSPESAIALWKKGIEMESDSGQRFILHQGLIDAYIDLKREDEAREHIVAYFFPERMPAKLRVGRSIGYAQAAQWTQHLNIQQNGEVHIPALRIARLALRLGMKDQLLAKQQKEDQANAEAGLFPILLRLAERDPKLPGEVASRDTNKTGIGANLNQSNFILAIASECSTWPGIGDEPIRILQKLSAAPPMVSNPWMKAIVLRMTINIAKQTKNTAALDEALKQWCAELSRNGPAAQNTGVDELANIGMTLIQRRMIPEARQMQSLARAQLRGNNYQPESLLALEKTLLLAEGSKAQPEAFVTVAIQPDQSATLFWSIAPYARSDRNSDTADLPFIADEESPFVDQKYDLELVHLTPPNHIQRLALIPKAGARGQWKGKLPAGPGSIGARLVSGDTEYNGPWTSYNSGKNLLDPKGWRYPAASEPLTEKDLLYPGSVSTRFEGSMQNDEEITSGRIAVEPGKRYQVGGWMHTQGNGWFNINLRCLDTNGKEITNSWIQHPQSSLPGWAQLRKRFIVSNLTSGRESFDRLDQKTAAVEITIRTRGTIRLLDISLIQVKEDGE